VCDPQRLAQVVLNLLANARAAVAESGGRGVVRVVLDRVDGAESRLPDPRPTHAVRIAVEDRGPGVPVELRRRIFEAFVTTKTEGRGTGLGLHVSRSMVEEAGGTLYLDESYAPGARFVVELPAAGASAPPGPAASRVLPPPPRGLKILVVDDDRDVLETYQVVLALDHHEVKACDRGKAALAACAAEDFDAVVCDVRLPDLGGREFVEALARIKPALAARVIFATGDVTAADTLALLSSTPQPSLQKPFRIEELEAAIRAVAPPRPE
jgi:CheY-like chemotaxis protein